MYYILLFILAILPTIVVGCFIYGKDKNKEPKKLLIKLFFGGIGSTVITTLITVVLGIFFPIFVADVEELDLLQLVIHAFICVALVEEFSKWVMAYYIAYNDKEFDELYDAIVYCAFVALGFATLENIMYVFQYGVGVAILRMLATVPGHALWGAVMGYYIGLAKEANLHKTNNLEKKYLLLSVIVPAILHGIFDYCLMSQLVILVLIWLVFVIVMYVKIIKKIKHVASSDKRVAYKNNFCPNCGQAITGQYCGGCGRRNE